MRPIFALLLLVNTVICVTEDQLNAYEKELMRLKDGFREQGDVLNRRKDELGEELMDPQPDYYKVYHLKKRAQNAYLVLENIYRRMKALCEKVDEELYK